MLCSFYIHTQSTYPALISLATLPSFSRLRISGVRPLPLHRPLVEGLGKEADAFDVSF